MLWLKVAQTYARMKGYNLDGGIKQAKRGLLRWIIATAAIVVVAIMVVVLGITLAVTGVSGFDATPNKAFAKTAAAGNQCDQNHPVSVTVKGIKDLTPDQQHNASVIIGVGERRGIAYRGLLYSIAVAMQESRLTNLPGGDRDSVGLFQQRPSQGWGTPAQILDPVYASNKFFDHLVANFPDYETFGGNDASTALRNGLTFVVSNVQVADMSTTSYYLQYLPLAQSVLTAAGLAPNADNSFASGGTTSHGCGNAGTLTPGATGKIKVVLAALNDALAKQWTYVWDAGNASGPTKANEGTGCDSAATGGCNAVGFDCSGLTKYVYSLVGVDLPHQTNGQIALGTPVNVQNLQPGDLVFFGSLSNVHHVGTFIRKDGDSYLMIDTPTEGQHVMTHYFYGPKDQEGDFVAARRYV